MSQAQATRLNAIALPWHYNPSSWRQRIPICVLSMVACAISVYLALYQWRAIGWVWDPVFGGQSAAVLDSNISEQLRRWLIVPDAALGAMAYLSDAIFGLAGSTRRWHYRPWLVILFGLDVIPLGAVSAVLVVLQGAVVGSWCFLCLVTAAISLTLVYLSYDEVWSSMLYLYHVWRHTGSKRVVWNTFCGQASPIAHQVAVEMLLRGR